MKKVSIIVPIYNVEPYLKRCIDSILQQTYSNLEVILVDDGSPDHCPDICDWYAKQDNRIIVVHKKNGGLSDARNAGLTIASGELVAFVDSDDWISPYYIEVMIHVMEDTSSDIVECECVRTDGLSELKDYHEYSECCSYNTKDALKLLIEDSYFHQTVWNKLYTRSVLAGILFEYGKYNEDEFWTYQVFGKAKNITKINSLLYYYFQNSSSIMGQGYKLKRLDAIEAKIERQVYVEKYFPELSNVAITNLLESIIYAGQMSLLYLEAKECNQAIKMLCDTLKKLFAHRRYHFTKNLKQKIWLVLAKWNLVLICRIRNFLGMNV